MSRGKRNGLLLMTGFISYFIGTGIYDYIIEGTNGRFRTLFSFGFGVVLLGLMYWLTKQVKPDVIKEMAIEKKDEREDFIRGKASQTTLAIVTILLFAATLLLILTGQEILSYAISLVFILIVLIYTVSQRYYLNKM